MTITKEKLLAGSATVEWDNTSMTGTTKRVTTAITLTDLVLDASWHPAWTDGTTVLGAFGVDLSNDLATWTAASDGSDFLAIGPPPATNSSSQLIHGALRARYARLTYTNVSGTGTLTGGVHVNGKQG